MAWRERKINKSNFSHFLFTSSWISTLVEKEENSLHYIMARGKWCLENGSHCSKFTRDISEKSRILFFDASIRWLSKRTISFSLTPKFDPGFQHYNAALQKKKIDKSLDLDGDDDLTVECPILAPARFNLPSLEVRYELRRFIKFMYLF